MRRANVVIGRTYRHGEITLRCPSGRSGGCYNKAMRALVIGVVLVAAVSISGCGSDDSSDDAATVASTDQATDPATETTVAVDVPDIVGDSVDEATTTLADAGLTLRILRLDGDDLPATADYVPTRVNVAVETEDGTEVVTEVISIG